MLAHVLVYIFLGSSMAAMLYVVGMPWTFRVRKNRNRQT
jgi:hypothetical protein